MKQMQHCISLHSTFHADQRDSFEKGVLPSVVAVNETACFWTVQTLVNEKLNRWMYRWNKNIFRKKILWFSCCLMPQLSWLFWCWAESLFYQNRYVAFWIFVLLLKTYCFKVKKKSWWTGLRGKYSRVEMKVKGGVCLFLWVGLFYLLLYFFVVVWK